MLVRSLRPSDLLLGALLAGALATARPARAATALGVGADALLEPGTGAFQVTLAGDTTLVRHLAFGGRIGLLVATGPTRLGVPADLRLRVAWDRVYLDGLVGPWLVFDDGDTLRFHAAVGFGLARRDFTLGLEVGALDRSTLLGIRLALPL